MEFFEMSLGLVSSLDLLGDIGGAISGAAAGAFDQVIIPLLRTICFFFDSIVYSLIAYSYTILLYLASIDLGSVPYLKQIVSRLYVLLGIFMLFKVSFSIIQYIADPNAFTDKGKGFGKLVTNVLVSVVLLISVPTIFEAGYKLQGFILESNAIGKLIMGNSTGGTINVNSASSMAKDVQFLMYGAFFSINGDGADLKACKNTPILGSTSMARSYETGDTDCLSALNDFFDSNEEIKNSGLKLTSFFKTGNTTEDDNRNFGGFGVLASAKQSDNTWVANYLPIVSALAGGYVALLLIMFCIDIAVRVIKLCFLQMIAPISIISYIDPKESISDSKLRKWISETLKTYLSLFIRLATIFLVMVLIQLIANTVLAGDGIGTNLKGYMKGIDTSEIDWSANMFIYVFLVIGAFMFAKKVPEMVENLFGIKMTGELHLASAGKTLLGGTIGAGIGGIASGIATASYAGINGKNKLGAFASGFTKGTIGGAFSGGKWDGKSGMSLVKNPLNVSGNLARYYGAKQGTTAGSRYKALFSEVIGGVQPADAIKQRIEAGNRYSKMAESFGDDLVAKANKMNAGKFNAYDGKNWSSEAAKQSWEKIEQYKNLKEQYDAAKQRGDLKTINAIKEGRYVGTYMKSDGSYGNFDDIRKAGTRFDDVEDDIKEEMYKLVNNQEIARDDDVQRIENKKNTLERIAKEGEGSKEFASITSNTFDTVSNINDSRKAVQTATQVTENSAQYEDAQQGANAIKESAAYRHFRK